MEDFFLIHYPCMKIIRFLCSQILHITTTHIPFHTIFWLKGSCGKKNCSKCLSKSAWWTYNISIHLKQWSHTHWRFIHTLTHNPHQCRHLHPSPSEINSRWHTVYHDPPRSCQNTRWGFDPPQMAKNIMMWSSYIIC